MKRLLSILGLAAALGAIAATLLWTFLWLYRWIWMRIHGQLPLSEMLPGLLGISLILVAIWMMLAWAGTGAWIALVRLIREERE